jgi:hypothetical protein
MLSVDCCVVEVVIGVVVALNESSALRVDECGRKRVDGKERIKLVHVTLELYGALKSQR